MRILQSSGVPSVDNLSPHLLTLSNSLNSYIGIIIHSLHQDLIQLTTLSPLSITSHPSYIPKSSLTSSIYSQTIFIYYKFNQILIDLTYFQSPLPMDSILSILIKTNPFIHYSSITLSLLISLFPMPRLLLPIPKSIHSLGFNKIIFYNWSNQQTLILEPISCLFILKTIILCANLMNYLHLIRLINMYLYLLLFNFQNFYDDGVSVIIAELKS